MSHLRHRTIYFFKLCPICATVDFIKNARGPIFIDGSIVTKVC